MSIAVVGVNHRTAPLEVRERFAHAPRDVPAALERVLSAGARGGVLLSTCNRTEFYLAEPGDGAPEEVWALLTERLGDGRNASEYGYFRRDRDAVRHLYSVSAGLDSMILGESQIQGQVREAWEVSKARAGPVLHRLFQSALLVGARVRSETGLATGAASAPSAAVALAGKIFHELAGRSALILGAGDTAQLAAGCLVAEGVRVTLVANRTYERAQAIAEGLGARALTLDEAWDHFATADIVLSSTAAPQAVVTWERVAPAIARRRGRPLCILDLAVPRDVAPAVGQLENVFLYDIDDLQAVAARKRGGRAVLGVVRRPGRRAGPEGVPGAARRRARRGARARAQAPRASLAGRPGSSGAVQPGAAEQVPALPHGRPQGGGAGRARVRAARGAQAAVRPEGVP